MPTYCGTQLSVGLKIIFEHEPYEIESSQFIKPGKGQAFSRIKMRRLLFGTLIEKRFKSTDLLEEADIVDVILLYSYKDQHFFYFVSPKTFEQYSIDIYKLKEIHKWLYNNEECVVTLWNDKIIKVKPPNFISSKVIKTAPCIKGDTVIANSKFATLITGAVIKVPSFVKINEIIKIDTRSSEYVSRIRSGNR